MDRIEGMRILAAVVENGGFSAAARRLRMPLATVSRKVADLEAHLGNRLLTRTSRRVEVTDSGRDYLEAARRILIQVEEAERLAAGEYAVPRGLMTITAPLVFGRLHVVPTVVGFLKAFPDVSVNLVLNDRIVGFEEDHIDLAVRIGKLPDSGMIAAKVGEVRRVVCASADYLAAQGTPRKPHDLTNHHCISFDGSTATEDWRFGGPRSGESIPIKPRLAVNTAEAAIGAAVCGLGVTRVLSYQVAAAVSEGRLRLLLDEYSPPPLPVTLLRAASRRPPRAVRAFIDFATPLLRAALSSQGSSGTAPDGPMNSAGKVDTP